MINETVGPNARPYFPFILTIFLFILTLNMVGLLPYAFTVTSQIIITFFLAIVIFIGVTIVGFAKNGIGFLKIFAPSGVPVFLFPIIVAIEIISFLSRPISLSVRCFKYASLKKLTTNKKRRKKMELAAAKMIGAGLAAIALAGVGVGMGTIFGNYLSAAIRNPSAAQKQFPTLLLGFALTEAIGLFALVIALLILST